MLSNEITTNPWGSAMTDVTLTMNVYRECTRNLWNTYFLPLAGEQDFDLRDRFGEIEKLLFSVLVLEQLGIDPTSQTDHHEPVKALKLVPCADSGVPIMINRPSEDGNKYWDDPVDRVSPTEVDLRFIECFDWDVCGHLEMRYYMARIASFPDQPHLVGRDALIDTSYVKVILDTE
jgi:hypothetical protein